MPRAMEKDNNKKRSHSIIIGALVHDIVEIKRALQEDADCINHVDDVLGVSALHIAAADGNSALVDFLCKQPGCDPHLLDRQGRRAAFLALAIGRPDICDAICVAAASGASPEPAPQSPHP